MKYIIEGRKSGFSNFYRWRVFDSSGVFESKADACIEIASLRRTSETMGFDLESRIKVLPS